MRQIVYTYYVCEICGAEYEDKESARRCESAPMLCDTGEDEEVLWVGQPVRAKEPRYCSRGSFDEKFRYRAVGRVVDIRGPEKGDFAMFAKWLGGGVPPFFHVYKYMVEFTCPYCKEVLWQECVARELEPR